MEPLSTFYFMRLGQQPPGTLGKCIGLALRFCLLPGLGQLRRYPDCGNGQQDDGSRCNRRPADNTGNKFFHFPPSMVRWVRKHTPSPAKYQIRSGNRLTDECTDVPVLPIIQRTEKDSQNARLSTCATTTVTVRHWSCVAGNDQPGCRHGEQRRRVPMRCVPVAF